MDLMDVSFWYLLAGILFANGLMHFVIGLSGHRFLSWFGKSANANIAWGISNVLGATGLAVWRGRINDVMANDVLWLIAGFWIVFVFAGVAIKKVLPSLN